MLAIHPSVVTITVTVTITVIATTTITLTTTTTTLHAVARVRSCSSPLAQTAWMHACKCVCMHCLPASPLVTQSPITHPHHPITTITIINNNNNNNNGTLHATRHPLPKQQHAVYNASDASPSLVSTNTLPFTLHPFTHLPFPLSLTPSSTLPRHGQQWRPTLRPSTRSSSRASRQRFGKPMMPLMLVHTTTPLITGMPRRSAAHSSSTRCLGCTGAARLYHLSSRPHHSHPPLRACPSRARL